MGIETGLARAAGGIRRSSRVAMNITSVLKEKPLTTHKNNMRKRINNDLKERERRNTARTDHWLFCVDSVAASELWRSSPRLRTTRSSDRPNYKRRERESNLAPDPPPALRGSRH